MTITDIFVVIGMTVIFSNALANGLLHTLLWPIITLISCLVTITAYLFFNNLLMTITAYIITAFLIKIILWYFQQKNEPTVLPDLSMLNRSLAGIISLPWGALLAFGLVLGSALIPFEKFGLAGIPNDVFRSRSYGIIRKTLDVPSGVKAPSCSACHGEAPSLSDHPLVQDLIQDPRIIQFINDTVFQNALREKDWGSLAQSPILKELWKDPVFLLKLLRLQLMMRNNTTP